MCKWKHKLENGAINKWLDIFPACHQPRWALTMDEIWLVQAPQTYDIIAIDHTLCGNLTRLQEWDRPAALMDLELLCNLQSQAE